jgi:peptide/nickel transport system substrate-binding protein
MGRSGPADDRMDQFERFLDEWSRRDFLRGMGGAVAFTAFMAGGAELLAACGSGAQTAQTQNVKKGGHVVEGSTSDPTIFTPGFITDTASNIPSNMMYEDLLNQRQDGTLTPGVAKSVPKVESDGLTYRFELRQDVMWSDGKPLTSDDALFSYNLQSPGSPYNYRAINTRNWPDLEKYVASVTAPDKYSLVVKTKVPYGPFLTNYTLYPLPKHVMEQAAISNPADFKKADFNTNPQVVSGVFLFDRWDKGSQVTLKANPKYYLGRPNLDQYVIRTVSDSTAIVNQLKTGELDVGTVLQSLWDDLGTATNVKRIAFTSAGWYYFGYNMDPTNAKRPVSGKIFGDPATGRQVRQALYYAVDRQRMVDAVLFKQGVVATSVEPRTSWALTDQGVAKYPHDPKKAAQLLDDAGWKMGSDGVRVKDGVRFNVELVVQSGAVALAQTMQIIAEQWRQVGVATTQRTISFPEFVNLDNSRDFDVMVGSIVSGVDPDLSQIYHSRIIGHGLNAMGYRSTRVDDLLDQAVASVDQAKRKQLYVQVQQALMEDVPSPILVWPRSLYGVSARVQNYALGPFNRFGRPWLKDVWVSDGR